MRGFSSLLHPTLITFPHRGEVQPILIPRANLALLVATVLACGLALGGVAASLRSRQPPPSQAPSAASDSPAPSASLAVADVPGEDIERLPRIPGSVRTAHDVVQESGFRLTANEYQVDATVDEVRTFYQGVVVEHGWERADINFDHGEWSYVLVDGGIEALIEIEEFGGQVEVDLQVSEPVESTTPTPRPAGPTGAPAPTSAPAAPPPPPRDDDDDGGDDDTDGGDDAGGGSDDD
jgi:hypothetical protein